MGRIIGKVLAESSFDRMPVTAHWYGLWAAAVIISGVRMRKGPRGVLGDLRHYLDFQSEELILTLDLDSKTIVSIKPTAFVY